jgi:hypothetical protein
MGELGNRIDEMGILIEDADGFAFRRDVGGRYRLDLNRVAIKNAKTRVRIIGVLVGDGLVDVDAVASV